MYLTRRGFTLAELVVGLALATAVSGTCLTIVVRQYRLNEEQKMRADAGATLRAASLMLADELRQLGADSSGSDIVRVSVNALEYRAVRQWRFVCGVAAGTPALILEPDYRGLREIDPARDSLLVYLEAPDSWVALGVVSLTGGTCPDGSPGVTVAVGSLPAAAASAVVPGAPVRAFERAELKAYRGGNGEWWIGMRALVSGRWPSIQPLLGPIAPGGMEITAYDSTGAPTVSPLAVERLEVLITAPGVRSRGASPRPSTTLRVTLRNGGP